MLHGMAELLRPSIQAQFPQVFRDAYATRYDYRLSETADMGDVGEVGQRCNTEFVSFLIP